ncbi:glycosyl transferase [Bacteroidia bacterium]|nr:glycosyl transferase [Bacteroidia bacterium]GHT80449.1 glycosyl transferase [Bacteroidia bacterium]
MIPKKIHWIWLSGDPLPYLVRECIHSWQVNMPDYEIVLWDKQRFDLQSVQFVADAVKARKWAFAADYIRCYALYTEGGIYLDSDVMVFDRFDRYLSHSAFSGVEWHTGVYRNKQITASGDYLSIEAAMIGAEQGCKWMKLCKEKYEQSEFTLDKYGIVTIGIAPAVLGCVAAQHFGFNQTKSPKAKQELAENIVIYPQNEFSHFFHGANRKTKAMHLCLGGWKKKSVIGKAFLDTIKQNSFSSVHYVFWFLWLIFKTILKNRLKTMQIK